MGVLRSSNVCAVRRLGGEMKLKSLRGAASRNARNEHSLRGRAQKADECKIPARGIENARRYAPSYLLKDPLEFQEHRLYGDDVLEHVLIRAAVYPEAGLVSGIDAR